MTNGERLFQVTCYLHSSGILSMITSSLSPLLPKQLLGLHPPRPVSCITLSKALAFVCCWLVTLQSLHCFEAPRVLPGTSQSTLSLPPSWLVPTPWFESTGDYRCYLILKKDMKGRIGTKRDTFPEVKSAQGILKCLPSSHFHADLWVFPHPGSSTTGGWTHYQPLTQACCWAGREPTASINFELQIQTLLVQIMALPCTRCVTLGMLSKVSKICFLICKMEIIIKHLLRLLWWFIETPYVKD